MQAPGIAVASTSLNTAITQEEPMQCQKQTSQQLFAFAVPLLHGDASLDLVQ